MRKRAFFRELEPSKKSKVHMFFCFCLIPAMVSAILYSSVWAGQFPDGPIKFITPTPPGGTLDILGRCIQPFVQKTLNVSVTIENVPGASHKIGLTRVWKTNPDGYTLISNSIPQNIIGEAALFKTDYRIKDFAYICAIAKVSSVLFVNWDNWKSFEEFLSAARQRTLAGAVSGVGSGSHLSGLVTMDRLKINTKWVNFDSGGEAITSLAGKHTDFTVTPMTTALSLYTAKKIRPLVVFDSEPDESFPDIPTIRQKGVEITTTPVFFGILAPPGTPADRVRVLENAFQRAVSDPALQKISKERKLYISFISGKDYRNETDKQYEVVEKYQDLFKAAFK